MIYKCHYLKVENLNSRAFGQMNVSGQCKAIKDTLAFKINGIR